MNTYKKILLYIILLLPVFSTAALNPLNQPDLKLGDTHTFVKQLQTLFNNNGLIINKTAGQPGSQGFETTYFGEKTKQALIDFQNKYKITPATGALGVKTKTKINDLLTSKQWSEVSSGKVISSVFDAYNFTKVFQNGVYQQYVGNTWSGGSSASYGDHLFYNFMIDGYGGLPMGSCLQRSQFITNPTERAICARMENSDLFRSGTSDSSPTRNLLIKNATIKNAFRTANVVSGTSTINGVKIANNIQTFSDIPHTDSFQSYMGGVNSSMSQDTVNKVGWLVIQDSVFANSDNGAMVHGDTWYKGAVYQNLSTFCEDEFKQDTYARNDNDFNNFPGNTGKGPSYPCGNQVSYGSYINSPVWLINVSTGNNQNIVISNPGFGDTSGPVIVIGNQVNVTGYGNKKPVYDANGKIVNWTAAETVVNPSNVKRFTYIEDALAAGYTRPPYIELSCSGWRNPPSGCEVKQGYLNDNRPLVPPTGNNTGGNTGGNTSSGTPTQPTITSPSTSSTYTSPATNSITFTWTSTSTTFLTRFATTTSNYSSIIGSASMDDNYGSKSRTYTVTPGNYYKFWVHAGTSSNYSPQAEINIYVSPSANITTYTVTAAKTGTGAGSIVGISQAVTTLNQGDSLTLTAEADTNSVFTGWSGDCSGTGSCVINNIQANRNISANFNSTLVPQFSNGDRVKTIRNTNVRNTGSLSATLVGVQPLGNVGTIATSTPIYADGYVWYIINYDNGMTGWSGQDNLISLPVVDNFGDTDNDNIDDTSDKCPNTPTNIRVNNHGCPLPTTANLKLISNATTSDITNISDLEITDKNSTYGRIKYNQVVNMFGTGSKDAPVNLDDYIQIQNKRVIVRSDLAPQFNKPATVTLYGVTYNKPIIKKDGEVYATSTSPHIVSYDRTTGTLVFTVNGFSTYDIIEDTVTYNLFASKTGAGTGSIVGISQATTTYAEGSQVSVTAQADNGSTFSGWSGDCLGTGSCSLTMNSNKTIVANFTLNPVTTGGGGGGGGGGGSVTTTVTPTTTSAGGGGGGGGSNNTTTTTTTNNTNTTTTISYSFNTDLKLGMRHPDVKKLQQYLNNNGYIISTSGSGSKGNESDYFGPATQKALIKYQQVNSLTPAAGYFGKLTRTKLGTVNIQSTNTTTVSIPVTTNTPVSATSFLVNLKIGMRHLDVKLLQQFLNNKGYIISTSGSGSKGNESDYFGPATQRALIRYQIDNKIAPAQGYFGPVTRDKVSGRK